VVEAVEMVMELVPLGMVYQVLVEVELAAHQDLILEPETLHQLYQHKELMVVLLELMVEEAAAVLLKQEMLVDPH